MNYKLLIYIVLIPLLSGWSTSYATGAEQLPQDTTKIKEAEQRKLDYFFYEGINLKAAGKFDAAYDLFHHCLAIDSTASAVLFELSSFYARLNRPEKSIEMLRRAVAHNPDNFTYRLAFASMSRNMGMYGEAAEAYEKLVKDFPNKVELNYYLADVLVQEGEIGKAIEAYELLESSIGMNEALSLQKHKLYNLLDQPEKANDEFEKLIRKFPMEARFLIMLGDLHMQKNDTVKAAFFYNKAYEIDPENPLYTVSMANYYEAVGNKEAAETQIKNALANDKLDVQTKIGILSSYILRLQQEKKETDGANVLFQSLLEMHPEDIILKQMYGSLLLTQNKQEEAAFQFRLITEIDPADRTAWQQLLNLALKKEDLPEVIRICTRCQELFPEAPEYYFYLGIAYYQQEKYQEALDTYMAGIRIIPNEDATMKSDFYGQVGDIYYQIKKLPEAYKAYDEALKYNDKNVAVLNNYAYFLSLDHKELKKAERMSALTVKMEPNNPTYLDTYAWIFFVQGNYTLAKIYIENALANDKTNNPELIDHYGDILFMTGEKEKALEQWKKAKEMGKESKILDRKIAEETYVEEQTNE